jgi:hypothetical protein
VSADAAPAPDGASTEASSAPSTTTPAPEPITDATLTPERRAALEKWAKHPWKFFTAKDPHTRRPIINTVDVRDKTKPLKPFPAHRYLRIIIEVFLHETHIFITKASQMYATTIVMLWLYWQCLFRDRSRSWLSKSTEDEAKELLQERIRDVHAETPRWFQDWANVSETPARIVRFRRTKGRITGLAKNLDKAGGRGATVATAVVDEAEFQDHLAAVMTAALPRATQTIALSTPNPGSIGGDIFEQYLEIDTRGMPGTRTHYEEMPGLLVRRTSKGAVVIELDYWADPAKDAKWAEAQRPLYPGRGDFERELERSRSVIGTNPYYPEYSDALHLRSAPDALPDLPVDCGWDLGRNKPAAMFSMYSPAEDLFWALRELAPVDIGIWDFVALVLFVRGQWEEPALEKYPRAVEIVAALRKSKHYPDPPWFAPNTTFRDYSGPEALAPAGGVAPDRREKTDRDIVESFGLQLNVRAAKINARTSIFRRLLAKRADGSVGFYVDPWCPVLRKALAGGLEKSRTNPQKPAKGKGFDDVHDGVGYTMVQIVPVVPPNQPGTITLPRVPGAILTKETAAYSRA